ncbi:neuronal acetylcholine receptor subunit alpha-7-like isoform X2 [Mytilus californianus]|uniref:neuronal acetylcholine receptor subunit alpha-7-like isoform X2 n=1 Tax=Mytilus californianus TaxID=6549 RepID=UPI00224736B9|nr:neuronal acetylcholine receptor subunit alpha-7-like isoform X2 [Mytilus californianus]
MKVMRCCVFLNYVVLTVFCINDETFLWKNIMDHRDYNKYIRKPIVNKSEPVEVEIEIALYTIHSLDMKDQILTTSLGISMSWTDEFLTWNNSLNGETNEISAPISKIWKPDVFLRNYAEKSNIFDDNDKRVNIYSNGLVEWHDDIEVKTYCFVDSTRYPFETENCKLHFSAQHLNSKEQMLTIRLPDNFLNLFKSNGEWHISKPDKIRNYTTIVHFNGRNFSSVVLHIEMDRRQTYYVWKFFVPTISITLINIVTFFLPVNSGAKVTLSTFVLLGFTAMIELFNESLPSSSDKISYFGSLLWCLLGISGLILTVNVIITVVFKCGACERFCSILNCEKEGNNMNEGHATTHMHTETLCSSGICPTSCFAKEGDNRATKQKYIPSQDNQTQQGITTTSFSKIKEDIEGAEPHTEPLTEHSSRPESEIIHIYLLYLRTHVSLVRSTRR